MGVGIPVDFLLDSSRHVLGEYELSRLNHAANLRKELRALVEQIIDANVEARFARWLLEHGDELRRTVISVGLREEPLDLGGDADGDWAAEADVADRTRVDAAD